MSLKKQPIYKLYVPIVLATLSILVSSLIPPQPAAAHHAGDCSDVYTPLSSYIITEVNANKPAYVQVMNETNVPWEMLAAIHYRETSFGRSNPDNGQGIFQFVNGEGGPYPPGPVSESEFRRQLRFMATKVQNDYVWRGSVNRERRQLNHNEQNMAIVKDTLFSYNGRASVYADQASHFGYNRDQQPYEGSPYVMNRFDCPRARMGIITRDYGSLDGHDTRYGAYTLFSRLRTPANIRLISCDNKTYLVERYIRTKRLVTAKAKEAWNNFYSLPVSSNDPGCGYRTYSAPLERLIRSRTTGKVYLIDNGNAYLVRNHAIGYAWGLGNISSPDIPQFNGKSIHFLSVKPHLPRIATSSTSTSSNVYLLDKKKCYIIRDNEAKQLVRGYNEVPQGSFSASLLVDQFMPNEGGSAANCGEIDYSFKAGGNWYLLNHNHLLKVADQDVARWSEHLFGPTLSTDALSIFSRTSNFGHSWLRDQYSYKMNVSKQLERAANSDVGFSWGAHANPPVTRLLTNKIINNTTAGMVEHVGINAEGFRLFSCEGQTYLTERFIHRKRQVTPEAMSAWGFEGAYIPTEDTGAGCSYPTYTEPLSDIVRSRNTGKVYKIDNGAAYYADTQRTATAWGLGDIANGVYPQFNSDSIYHFNVGSTLPQLIRSDNTNKVYLIDDGKRHYVAGSEISDTPSLRLIRGYDEVPMITTPPSLLQTLPSGATIDYAFSVNGEWYLLDHNRSRKISNAESARWENFITGPKLSADILSLFNSNDAIGAVWTRDPYFYQINESGTLERTESHATAGAWGISDTSPVLTRMLTNRLIDLLGVAP